MAVQQFGVNATGSPAPTTGSAGADARFRKNQNDPTTVAGRKAALKKDIASMIEDPMAYGLSEAERQQIQAEMQAAGNAQRAAQQTQVARQALAGGEFQQQAFVAAQEAIRDTAANDVSRAVTLANQQSLGQVNNARAQLQARIEAEYQRKMANRQYWRDVGVKVGMWGLNALSPYLEMDKTASGEAVVTDKAPTDATAPAPVA